MGVEIAPEIKMARRLHQKYSLSIPVDLNKLVSKYAQVIYKAIPIEGVDGVCINLKNPQRQTKIVVNSSSPINRQRFTLAHELGHIIIPWHLGTIVDDIDANSNSNIYDSQYWLHEREANRFASELLMPFEWLYSSFLKFGYTERLVSATSTQCRVSEDAAGIRVGKFWSELIDYLVPPKTVLEEYERIGDLGRLNRMLAKNFPLHPIYVAKQMVEYLKGKVAFCTEENNQVVGSGATSNTHGFYQSEGAEFVKNPYPVYKSHSVYERNGIKTHWWDLNVEFEVSEDERSWQEILDKIAKDLVPESKIKSFKSSINGRFSGANGSWKRKYPERGIDDFINEMISRFNNAEDEYVFNHADFISFTRKRCMIFFGLSD